MEMCHHALVIGVPCLTHFANFPALPDPAFIPDRYRIKMAVYGHITVQMGYFGALSKRVVVTPLTGIKEIRGKTVVVVDVIANAERQIEGIDTVVVCTDEKPNDALYRSLKGKVKELYLVGQALAPRRLLDSIADAYVTARAL